MIGLILALVMSAAPLSTTVPHSRWLARCSAVPTSAADGITVVRAYRRPGVHAWWLRKGEHHGVLVCYRVGTYQSVGVYACHGPTVLRDRMAADPACSHVVAWPKVRSLPKAALTTIASGLICCGASSAGRAWRCDRSAAIGGDVTVTRLDGYGPAVVAGGSPCSDYQMEE